MRTEYLAVKCFDGSYLSNNCIDFTFDRNDMQLFLDDITPYDTMNKLGYKIDDVNYFIVKIDEYMLIKYITENSILMGNVNNDADAISIIKKAIPNPHISNYWYKIKVNNNELDVLCNTKGYYHVRKLVDTVLCFDDGSKVKNGNKHFVYYRINNKGELVRN